MACEAGQKPVSKIPDKSAKGSVTTGLTAGVESGLPYYD